MDPGVLIGYPVSRTDADPLVLGPGARPVVRIGAGALIGAGSVVTRDIPAAVVAVGHPAVPHREVADLPVIQTRVVADSASASPYRLSSGRGTRETLP